MNTKKLETTPVGGSPVLCQFYFTFNITAGFNNYKITIHSAHCT